MSDSELRFCEAIEDRVLKAIRDHPEGLTVEDCAAELGISEDDALAAYAALVGKKVAKWKETSN